MPRDIEPPSSASGLGWRPQRGGAGSCCWSAGLGGQDPLRGRGSEGVLPDWWLVQPGGPGEIAALATTASPGTVVWLDELQRYLDGERGLAGAVVRALLDALAQW